MLKAIHDVEYVVRSRDEIVSYMDRTFGMKPDKLLNVGSRPKEAQYRVGSTIIRFREPPPGHEDAPFLEKNGPGVRQVVWVVESIEDTARELKSKGVNLRMGLAAKSYGSNIIDIDPKESHGIFFRLIEAT